LWIFHFVKYAYLQGGSDISGTLSKLHYSIKKSSFLSILSLQTISALCQTICKNKQTHSGIDELAGTFKRRDFLRTSRGRTEKQMMSYRDINKNTVYDVKRKLD
jgi:hypothetical protein